MARFATATGTAPPKEREKYLFDRINQPDTYAAWLTERGLTGVAVTTHDLRLTMTPEVAWLVVMGSGYRGALAKLDATTLIGTGTSPGPSR